jgi:hypothetical protein
MSHAMLNTDFELQDWNIYIDFYFFCVIFFIDFVFLELGLIFIKTIFLQTYMNMIKIFFVT